jgi:hypothetical protein
MCYVRHLRWEALSYEMREGVFGTGEEGHGEFLDFFRGLRGRGVTFEEAAYSLVGNRIEELMIERNRYNNFMKAAISGRAYNSSTTTSPNETSN